MANTYYDSRLTDEQIEAALEAIFRVQIPENNGKYLGIKDGKVTAVVGSDGGRPDLPSLELAFQSEAKENA